jgi:GH43 family beta-xylosidase
MGAHIWAPEIHWIDDAWYVYFAADAPDKIWDIRIYVSSTPRPTVQAEWPSAGSSRRVGNRFAPRRDDVHARGKRYLVWAQNDPKLGPGTSLYIAAMRDPLTIDGQQVRISRPELAVGTIGFKVNEGPGLAFRNAPGLSRVFGERRRTSITAWAC